MILDRGLCGAVVAVYQSFRILELGRHRLTLNQTFKVLELHLHVLHTPTADGTSVSLFHMLVIAQVVDTMATAHEDDGLWRRKHVLSADWTVAVGRALNASMCIAY